MLQQREHQLKQDRRQLRRHLHAAENVVAGPQPEVGGAPGADRDLIRLGQVQPAVLVVAALLQARAEFGGGGGGFNGAAVMERQVNAIRKHFVEAVALDESRGQAPHLHV